MHQTPLSVVKGRQTEQNASVCLTGFPVNN
ncbi:uncharacterized protein METZ01_LOCUS46892 [marine metagenome]|uniref:Uncharacterized protein n=1 Tax=marine metagenome TaxID=408172 RepID=A0A381RSR4_9ZZZZ